MSKLSEEDIIDIFIYELSDRYTPGTNLNLKDDAGELNSNYLFNIDGYSSFNSKYPWETWEDWAWKAVVGSITDLIAKGALPFAIGFSIGLSQQLDIEKISGSIAKGIKEACDAYQLRVVKADTNSSKEDVWITVSSIGLLITDKPIPRSGVINKSYVYVTEVNGFGRLMTIYKKYLEGKLTYEQARGMYRRPMAPYGFLNLLQHIKVDASIDSSDGLAYSLGLIARNNKAELILSNLPRPQRDLIFLYETKEEMDNEVLYGGEEYEIIFLTKHSPEEVARECDSINLKCIYLGEAISSSYSNVFFNNKEISMDGWQHFR
jgi:thiamine-monophosphate kinase